MVSLLPEPYYGLVEEIWDELQKDPGLSGIRVTPFPHFSWQIGAEYAFDRLEAALAGLASSIQPFEVHTTGLGIFTGAQPVLYLQVVRSPLLTTVHEKIWHALLPAGTEISPYYGPDFWMPHISLAYADLTQKNIGAVLERLAFRTYNWSMPVDNLTFIYEPDGSTGAVKFRFDLRGA